jgi:amino acid transporter
MTRISLPLLCECLLFFIPLNIYGIGNNLATGVQWALFRYQQSYLGNSLILMPGDLSFVFSGMLKGSSAYSTLIWVLGAVLLVAALIVLAFAAARRGARLVKPAGLLTVACGVLFLAAMLVQYGLTLHSDHGFSLPLGIPLVLVTGLWLVYGEFDDGKNGAGDNGEDTKNHDVDCS